MIFSQQNLTQTKNKHMVHYCTILKKWSVVPSLVRAILRNSCLKKYMQAIIKNRLSSQKSWLWNSLMDHTKLSKNANIIKVKRGTSFIRPSLLQDHGIKIKTFFKNSCIFTLNCCLTIPSLLSFMTLLETKFLYWYFFKSVYTVIVESNQKSTLSSLPYIFLF